LYIFSKKIALFDLIIIGQIHDTFCNKHWIFF
jgi:hypothetical protein